MPSSCFINWSKFWACLAAAWLVCGADLPCAAAPGTAAAPALRKLAGRHLTLYTDLPADPEVDRLAEVFDAAVPQWCQYFGVDAKQAASWRVTGCLMRDAQPFKTAGLWPDDLPEFRTGFAQKDKLWLFDQTSPYYRRHLLLHEGTHAFMQGVLGNVGPPWYAEGMAELLATHRFANGLQLGWFPTDKRQVPKLGRIELVERAVAANRKMSLARILAYSSRAHLENEPYGWCWAAAAFLDGHPAYRQRFRKLRTLVSSEDVTAAFKARFNPSSRELNEEWEVFIANIDYGYDFKRMAINFKNGDELPADGRSVQVAADRGWQSSGIRLRAGKRYRISAQGRYQIVGKPRVWWCEPNGVSIRYVHGRPLGMLLAAVRPDAAEPGAASPLASGQAIGLSSVLAPEQDGTLYLRVNEAAGELGDNSGSLTVEVRPE